MIMGLVEKCVYYVRSGFSDSTLKHGWETSIDHHLREVYDLI